ncbi:uncharacterized protein LOC142471901 [Ascaphus truei]|uniref:uncharacterized protein LOC142471901 n=1 Tax=Ascaphus truei TaxID=8439 RepID=UPI003F5ADC92
MKAALSWLSLFLLAVLFWGMDSVCCTKAMENAADNSEALILETRDEQQQYPDYGSDEQDRWPTLEEMAKYSSQRRHSGKRGSYRPRSLDAGEGREHTGRQEGSERKEVYGRSQLPMRKRVTVQTAQEDAKEHILRRQNLESILNDLLSSEAWLPPKRRDMEDLNDLYVAADLLTRPRVPRSLAVIHNKEANPSSKIGFNHGQGDLGQLQQHDQEPQGKGRSG